METLASEPVEKQQEGDLDAGIRREDVRANRSGESEEVNTSGETEKQQGRYGPTGSVIHSGRRPNVKLG